MLPKNITKVIWHRQALSGNIFLALLVWSVVSNCQTVASTTNSNEQPNQFSPHLHKSDWTPFKSTTSRTRMSAPRTSSTSLHSHSSDGANFATTNAPLSSTVANDIKKLLEDYVTYLSTLPDFRRETNLAQSSSAASDKSRLIQNTSEKVFPIPESLALVSFPKNQFGISGDATTDIESRSDKTNEIILQEAPSNTMVTPMLESESVSQTGSNKYYLEMPTESGLTLNLSDDELSSFIDNVLGSSNANQSMEYTSVTTTVNSTNLVENSITIASKKEDAVTNTTPTYSQNFEFANFSSSPKSLLNSGVDTPLTTPISSATPAETTTDTSFSRAKIFENWDETNSNSNEENNNLVSKELSAADEKEFDSERYYTSDTDFATESSGDAPTTITESVIDSKNDTFVEEDKTSSNNFKRKISSIQDTDHGQGLLRIQMEKYSRTEPERPHVDITVILSNVSSELTTTEMSLLETTTTAFVGDATDANDSNASLFIEDITTIPTTSTESPAVTESVVSLFETTKAPIINDTNNNSESETTTTTPNNDYVDITTQRVDHQKQNTSINVVPGVFNYSIRPAVNSSVFKTLNVKKLSLNSKKEDAKQSPANSSTTTPKERQLDNTETTTVGIMLERSERVATNSVKPLPLTTAEVGNVSGRLATNGTNYDDALRSVHVIANEAENSTFSPSPSPSLSSSSSLDLTVTNSNSSFSGNDSSPSSSFNANDNGRNETDSETMIFTHVPKITIIHKIMKPNGNKSSHAGVGAPVLSEEETYREALRKHKELIKTAMSSISLYPAAFKRYRINNHNKVNIGEIYLLPNFSGGNGAATVNAVPEPLLVKHHQTPHRPSVAIRQFDRKFVRHLGQTLESATLGQAPQDSGKIVIRQATKVNGRPKFAYHRIGSNKFNAEDAGRVMDATEFGAVVHDRALQDRTKLYVNYLNSLVTKNQNPENIIKLYRPLFVQGKRFKKVRIPHGHRLRKKIITGNASTIHLIENNKQPVFLNSSPILITISQNHSDSSNLTGTISDTNNNHTTNERVKVSSEKLIKLHHKDEQKDKNSLKNELTTHASKFKVFCTYDAHRPLSFSSNDSRGRFFDINQLEQNAVILQKCTHLVYAFANINMNGEVMAGMVNTRDEALRVESELRNQQTLLRLKKLKERFPHLRMLVALGGWNTPPQLFSLLVATSKLRDRLSQHVHKFVLNYDFDGAIMSWFYPVYGSKTASESQRSTRSTIGQTLFQLDDKQNLVKFLRLLRTRFDSIPHKKLEIGLMSPPFEELIDRGYDVAKLNNLVDHMILMTYDYYGSWDDKVHHFAPLYPLAKNQSNERDQKLNINYTLDYWLNTKHALREKTILGVAFYGRSFSLENPSNAGPGAKAIGPGIAGPVTNKPGLLAFNELCDLYLGHPAVKLNEDEHRITAHLQLFDQWVGFDDELSLYLKTKYAIANNLSGIFIWSINHDDYRNRCGWGRFPLLKAINKAVEHCSSTAVNCK